MNDLRLMIFRAVFLVSVFLLIIEGPLENKVMPYPP
jgi:hypothetical protein